MSYTYVVACAGNLISFASGTALTWTSPELEKLENDETIQMTKDQGAWVSSLFQLGAVFGPFCYGFLADRIGRKYTVLSLGVPFAVCYLLMAFVKVVPVFYVSRFIIGFALGGVFTLVPMYLAEISDTKNRGLLSSLMNVFLCSGMLFSFVLGPYVSILVFNLILAIFPTIFTVVFFLVAPETPQYLIKKGKPELARQTLQKLRGVSADVEKEVLDLERYISEESSGSFINIFRSRGTLKAFCISIGLISFQQLTGINAVLSFSQTIFKDAGTSLDSAVCSIILGVMQFLSSFIAPLLVDRFGRKILLLVSVSGLVIAEVPLGVYSHMKHHGTNLDAISFLPILCMVCFILFYHLGIGPLSWTVSSELFPNNIKSKASSFTAAVAYTWGFFIVEYFGSLSDSIGMGMSFVIFSGFCVAAFAFIQFVVIETGRKTFEQIQKELSE